MLGGFSRPELRKFALLAGIFFLIIGSYWMMRPLKDAIFMAVVGAEFIPRAKILSLLIAFPLVLLYSRLVDIVPRHKLFYVLCSLYGVGALVFAAIMAHPELGLANTVAAVDRWWGWAWYVYVESFGSLVAGALFWAFVGDTSTPESAQRGYPLIAFGGQFGNIVGPLVLRTLLGQCENLEMGEVSATVAQESARLLSWMVVIVAVMMIAIMALVRYFMAVIPKEQLVGFKPKHEVAAHKPGFFEGFKVLLSSSYLLGIFGVISFYEVIVTIFDFNFKTLINAQYASAHASTIYLCTYAMWVGIISTASIALGINGLQRLIGLGASLALLPVIIGGAVVVFQAYPQLSLLFWIMVFSKAMNYALNQPTLKQLYIPTSKEAKYKSQAFVETYGSRGAKAAGSGFNEIGKSWVQQFGPVGLQQFISYCTYVSAGIISVWLLVALSLGKTYHAAVRDQREIC
jgi:ATP:ADP antiporter, AAA family